MPPYPEGCLTEIFTNMKNMYENSNPEGYHSVTPSITVQGAGAAIEFYQEAFGARVRRKMETPDGKIMHAEITFGDSAVMLSDEFPDWGVLSPLSIGGTSSTLQLYVSDVDKVVEQAVAAGAVIDQPLSDQFWGDRMGRVKDPFGHRWSVATRIEEVTDEEMGRRAEAWMQKGC